MMNGRTVGRTDGQNVGNSTVDNRRTTRSQVATHHFCPSVEHFVRTHRKSVRGKNSRHQHELRTQLSTLDRRESFVNAYCPKKKQRLMYDDGTRQERARHKGKHCERANDGRDQISRHAPNRISNCPLSMCRLSCVFRTA